MAPHSTGEPRAASCVTTREPGWIDDDHPRRSRDHRMTAATWTIAIIAILIVAAIALRAFGSRD
ncbi:MAG: hypothetical protein H6529_18990 [Nocardioides sp.]|nr:hypothetical protein [Nocardioides sp.]